MSYIRSHGRLLITAICCVALGAGASAIASAGAASGSSAHPRAAARPRPDGARSPVPPARATRRRPVLEAS